MKKRILALVLTFALMLSLAGAAIASGGSQTDPLISQIYLEETYLNTLRGPIGNWVKQLMQPDFDSAKSRLEQLAAGHLSSLGAADDSVLPEGWSSTESFITGGGERKDIVSLAAGASLLWTDGSAFADRSLVDVTAGVEVPAGTALVAGHRYVTGEQTVITVSSRTAYWAVQGVWTTTSDGVNVMDLPFTDVPEDSWYYDGVYYAVTGNLFNGTSDTTFSPMMTMQRGMLTTVLYRFSGSPQVEYTAIFKDVPAGTWYSDGTVWAGLNGVVSGAGDGRFLPGDPVARQQIAVILYNYAGAIGCDTSARGYLEAFSDQTAIESWARDAVSWAVAVGLLRGSDGKIMPTNSASRAEVAIILQRFESWIEQR